MTSACIFPAENRHHFKCLKTLFTEYGASLGFDLDFQHFDKELADIQAEYAAPHGCTLLAYYGDCVAGCIALRKFGKTVCEMKRLYVRPRFRGKGIGRRLVNAIVEHARRMGYTAIRLDTVSSMKAAGHLYESLGFREIGPYRYNPVRGARYFERHL